MTDEQRLVSTLTAALEHIEARAQAALEVSCSLHGTTAQVLKIVREIRDLARAAIVDADSDDGEDGEDGFSIAEAERMVAEGRTGRMG